MKIHVETPLWKSQENGKTVFFKMESFQPTGSFKSRGIGALANWYVNEQKIKHLVCASGGNAGYAAAYAGNLLNTKTTVVVPVNTLKYFKNKITSQNAHLIEHGDDLDEAADHAQLLANETNGGFISPYNHPQIWQGNSSIIDEVHAQLKGLKPGAVALSVGGGGLMIGVLEKMNQLGWNDIPLFGVETNGTNSLSTALAANQYIGIPKINSIATTLGAKKIAKQLFELSQNRKIHPITVSDRDAVHACKKFLDDHRVLVEPACGAALAALYDNSSPLNQHDNILLIACGGIGINYNQLTRWLQEFP